MSNICFIVRSFPVFLMEFKFLKLFFPRNTDACNIEDKNILHIKECLLLSCVASFEHWSSIFRTRSFTLFKNDRVHTTIDEKLVINGLLLPTFHQISTLEKTKFCQHSILSSLMSKRSQRVAPFYGSCPHLRTWFCDCPQYLCLFGILVECSQSIHDPGKMLVLPNQLHCQVVSTSDQDFVFSDSTMSIGIRCEVCGSEDPGVVHVPVLQFCCPSTMSHS